MCGSTQSGCSGSEREQYVGGRDNVCGGDYSDNVWRYTVWVGVGETSVWVWEKNSVGEWSVRTQCV